MKIAIIGAGAIGGYVAVKLALAGEDVTVMVRGANLAAIRKNGMKLIMHDGSEQVTRAITVALAQIYAKVLYDIEHREITSSTTTCYYNLPNAAVSWARASS